MEIEGKKYYCILLNLNSDRTLSVGNLGSNLYFPKGYYVYVGRAKKNIKSRINRHYRREKTKRWHIDYLSAEAEAVEAAAFGPEVGSECELAEKLQKCGGQITAEGFGSTDCCCPTHLIYFTEKPSLASVFKIR